MLDVIQECMKMTSFGGEAKSQALMAIRQAREGNFESAAESMKNAEEALLHSHKAHTALLSADATTGDIEVSVFMVHAADHLNAAETVFVLAQEIILLYKEVRRDV